LAVSVRNVAGGEHGKKVVRGKRKPDVVRKPPARPTIEAGILPVIQKMESRAELADR